MRDSLIILLPLLITTTAWAASPRDLPAILKESQSLRQAAENEKIPEKKIQTLKEFETLLNTTIKDYEKETPELGGSEEEKVVKFSYRFEPLFDLTAKKVTDAECEKTRERIEMDDQNSKPEGTPLSPAAQEALNWLATLCAKSPKKDSSSAK